MSGYSYDTYAIRILIRLGYNSRSIHVRYIDIFTRYIVSKYDTSRPSYLVLGYERLGGTGGGLYRCVYHVCIVSICAESQSQSIRFDTLRYTHDTRTIRLWGKLTPIHGEKDPVAGSTPCGGPPVSNPRGCARRSGVSKCCANDRYAHSLLRPNKRLSVL